MLIANYNNGRYLTESIESIKKQSYKNWEIVIVDDGSTDNSKEVYKKYLLDHRIRIYFNGRNRYCGFTKRRCIELSKGEICGFVDSDDALADNNALEIMVKLHKSKPECSLVYSTCYLCNDINDIIGISDRIGKIEDGEDFLINSKKGIAHFATFKRSFYDKTTGINPKLHSAEDNDLYFKLEEAGSIYYFDKPLYLYRTNNPNSISIGNQKKIKDSFLFHIIASLDACERRIKSNSLLYLTKKGTYHYQYRVWLNYYIRNKKALRLNQTIHYCFFYLTINKFTLSSFNHLIKLNKCFEEIITKVKTMFYGYKQ